MNRIIITSIWAVTNGTLEFEVSAAEVLSSALAPADGNDELTVGNSLTANLQYIMRPVLFQFLYRPVLFQFLKKLEEKGGIGHILPARGANHRLRGAT